jgi:signal transduction histidine kinase
LPSESRITSEVKAAEFPRDPESVLREVDSSLESTHVNRQARADFIANMSHEPRTPLNSIIGFAEVLQQPVFGELTSDQQSYVTDILDSGRHLLSLINDILDISKIESGKMELNAEQVDRPKLIDGSLRMFREQAFKASISLEHRTVGDVQFIEADERKGPSANKLPNWYRKSFDGSVRMRGCRMHKLSMDWNRSLMRS